jgi:UDP-glucuronate 4-epimerase
VSVLVTGASGFIGLNLLDVLLARPGVVVGFSAEPIPWELKSRLPDGPGVLVEVCGDIRDAEQLTTTMLDQRVTRVAHLAAVTAGEDRERRAAADIVSVNLVGAASVLQAASDAGVPIVLYAGSVAVFGGGPDGGVLEEDAAHAPRTLYGITKSAAETIVTRLGSLHGLDWTIARLGRVFGPFERDTAVRDTLSQIAAVTRLATLGRPAAFARPCVKNWSYGRDAAAALATLLGAPARRHRVYHLGTPHVWPLAAWCDRLTQRFPGFTYTVGSGAGEMIDLGGASDGALLSWHRFEAEFGPPARYDLDAAFDDYMTWLGYRA